MHPTVGVLADPFELITGRHPRGRPRRRPPAALIPRCALLSSQILHCSTAGSDFVFSSFTSTGGGSSDESDKMLADLIRMSTYPKRGESLDLCSDGLFIHMMDHKKVDTQITKIVKQRQHSHTLFQQYRLVASGGTERVVCGLKPFFSSFRNYRTRAKAQNAAVNAVLATWLRCGEDIQGARPRAGAAQAEREAQAAENDAQAAQLAQDDEAEVPSVMWDPAEGCQGVAEGDEQLDELATALSSKDDGDHLSYGLKVKEDALAFSLPLLMMNSCPTDGHISSTILARLTCDAARIRGQLVGHQNWTSVITQVMGNGQLGCEAARHRFADAMSSSRAIFDRVGPGSDNEAWLERNLVPYLRQIAACNRATKEGVPRIYNLILARSPLQFSPSDDPNDHSQSKWSPVFCFPRSPRANFPTPMDLSDQWAGSTSDWLDLLFHVVPTPLLVRWILGFDGGTFFSLTHTSPAGSSPDAWTTTTAQEMQRPYEYAVLKKGKSGEVFAAERDPESRCLADEIEHANDVKQNRRQFSITNPPREKPTLDAPQTGPLCGGTRGRTQVSALAKDRDPQLRAPRAAVFTEAISDDEDDDNGQPEPDTRIEYEDDEFNNLLYPFDPDKFCPPPGFTKMKTCAPSLPLCTPALPTACAYQRSPPCWFTGMTQTWSSVCH